MYKLHEIHINEQKLHGIATHINSKNNFVLHLHGTGGNFYYNSFINFLGNMYASIGYAFASVNLPGYDNFAKDEKFTDSRQAIETWLKHFGIESAILQGHSLGALKALDFCHTCNRNNIVNKLILLSPFDIVAFYTNSKLNDLGKIRSEVTKIKNSSDGATLVPKDIFSYWDISVDTFLELTSPEGPADRFPSRSTQKLLNGDWLTTLPTYLAIGGNDFACYPSPEGVYESLPKSNLLTIDLIANAPHGFDGYIDLLVKHISDWLKLPHITTRND